MQTDWCRTEVRMSDRNIEKVLDILEDPSSHSDVCNICFEPMTENPVEIPVEIPSETQLEKQHVSQTPVIVRECSHVFHIGCIHRWLSDKSTCPVCRKSLFTITGFQPRSPLSLFEVLESPTECLQGYPECGSLTLKFHVAPGTQTSDMPMPGEPYFGMNLTCFLPNNSEGQEIVRLFRIAWNRGLLFRVGFNPNTRRMDCVVPNGFEFKVRQDGGIMAHGYPDPSYMNRLKCDLKDVGVL